MNKIVTSRLVLRNITEDDDKDMYEYSKLEDVGPNAGWKPHESIEETREIMKAIFLNQPYVFAIFLKDSGKLIGSVGLLADPKREYDNAMMIGYSLSSEYKGNGYMTESAKAVIKFGFEKSECKIISAYCYPYNKASRGVIEKCHLTYEGTLRNCEMRYDGVLLDNLCYSITKSEYNDLKERF